MTHRLTLRHAVLALATLAVLVGWPSDGASGVEAEPPADVFIDITDAGFDPPTLIVEAGSNIHWTNNAIVDQAVTSTDTAFFDSGPLSPGDGFSINLATPGQYDYQSTGDGPFSGTIQAVLHGLEGAPGAPANELIPNIPFPPPDEDDISVHPALATHASRTRILIGFVETATVSEANAALSDAGVGILGGISDFGTLLGVVPDSQDFSIIDAAIASLRAHAAVEFAALDEEEGELAVPRHPNDPPIASFRVRYWEPVRLTPDPSIIGGGDNYNIEIPRFPQAWNLLEAAARKSSSVSTGIMEVRGYGPHEDLNANLSIDTLCWLPLDLWCSNEVSDDHGNHVAGIIGADFDNAVPGDPNRSLGVSGTNPLASMHGMTLSGLIAPVAWDLLLDRVEGDLPDLRVLNYSGAWTLDINAWWSAHPHRNCGPGINDDGHPGSSEWCTRANDDAWLQSLGSKGELFRRIAERAASLNVLIVQAAGNETDDFCPDSVDTNGDSTLDAAELDAYREKSPPKAPYCPDGGILQDGRHASGFGSAHLVWRSALPRPLLVESHDANRIRSTFSNTGELGAPGDAIWSTVLNNQYAQASGSSMAAPHVAGLIGYLLEYEPGLTAAQARSLVLDWARTDADVPYGQAPRIDAFLSLMAVPGATRDLVDVNDDTVDGNRRVILDAEGAPAGLDLLTGKRTDPDGRVNMRDFRRFRDAWLQTCLDPSEVEPACPPAAGIDLNGPPLIAKKDLNFDGCVHNPDAATDCPAHENWYTRFDFNGDGRVGLTAEALLALKPDGSTGVPADLSPHTDLDVLARFFEEGAAGAEGWTRADLAALMQSADIEIHADAFFEAGASSIAIEAVNTATDEQRPVRILEKPADPLAPDYAVLTLPPGTWRLVARASTGTGELVSAPITIPPLPAGSDRRVDLAVSGIQVLLGATELPADGASTASVLVRVSQGPLPVEGADVTVSLSPSGAEHASIVTPSGVTDANGEFRTTFRAGTAVADYILSATADLGGGATATTTRTIAVRPPLKIYYLWQQENLAWSQTGSTRWAPAPAAGQPDCTVPGVVDYCLTGWTVSLEQPAAPIQRFGVIEGFGDRFRLSETVDVVEARSTSQWTRTAPDGSNAVASGELTAWGVFADQVERYTDYALPRSVAASETGTGLELRGLSALASLGYEYDAASVLEPGTTDADELTSISSQLLLVPTRGDASAFQYAGDTTMPIRFTRNPDGTYQPYTFCGEINRTTPLSRGYRVASPSEWVPGTNDTTRKPNYEAGDLPMPEGSEHLHVRYSFVAVATTGDLTPLLALPDCSVNNPPVASFTFTPAAPKEGRVVLFHDTSSDAENNIASWEWSFGDGKTGSGRAPHHIYEDNGTYTVVLTVTDINGLTGTYSETITAGNLPPEVQVDDATVQQGADAKIAYRTADPGHVDKQSLTIDVTSTAPGVGPLTFDEAAGNFALEFNAGAMPVGTYSVTVTATDKDGASASDTAAFTVTAGPPPPPPPAGPPATTCDPGVALDAEEQAFLELVNEYRALNGVGPVVASPTLTRAAERHVADMAQHPEVEHAGSDGSDPLSRAKDAQFTGAAVGENVARDLETGVAVLFGWRSSTEGHDGNMLNPRWVSVGVARAFDAATGWSWATTYGDVTDCPEPEVSVSRDEGERDSGGPEALFVLGSLAGDRDEATLARLDDAGLTREEATGSNAVTATGMSLDDFPPVPAFVISPANPDAGEPVTFRNRSRDASGVAIPALIDTGNGAVQSVGPDATFTASYDAPGVYSAAAAATDSHDRTGIVARAVTVAGAPATPTAIATSTNTPTATATAPAGTPTATATPGAPVGGCFGVPQDVSDVSPHVNVPVSPSIAVDGDDVYAAWEAGDGAWFSVSHDGGATFSPALKLATRAGASTDPLQPVVAASGSSVVVVYVSNFAIRSRASSDAGASFGAEVVVAGSSFPAANNVHAAFAGPTFYVTWQAGSLYAATSANGGASYSLAVVGGASGARVEEAVRVSDGGSLHVAWRESPSGSASTGHIKYRKLSGAVMDVEIQLKADSGFGPALATDGSQIFVAWRDTTGGLLLRRSADGGATFQPELQVSPETATEISAAAAGADVFIAWRRSGAGMAALRLAVSHDGGSTFGAAALFADAGAFMPRLAITGGKLYAAWMTQASQGSAAELKVAVSNASGVLGGAQHLATGVRNAAPLIAADGGRLHFAWHGLVDATNANMFLSRTVECSEPQAPAPAPIPVAAEFKAPANLTDGPLFSSWGSSNDVATSEDRVYAVYEQGQFHSSYPLTVQLRASGDRGKSFGPPTTLGANDYATHAADHLFPSVAASGSMVFVAWQQKLLSGNEQLWAAVSTDYGATFAPPVLIATTAHGLGPQVEAVIADGTLYVFVMSWLGTNSWISMSASSDSGATWMPLQTAADEPGWDAAFEFNVSASGGTVHLTWRTQLSTSSTAYTVYHRTISGGGTVMTPPVTIAQPYGMASAHLARGNDVYVAFDSLLDGDPTKVRRSTDGGLTFEPPVSLGIDGVPVSLIADGETVYVATVIWNLGLAVSVSHDGGATFGPPAMLGREPKLAATLAQVGGTLVAVWYEGRTFGETQLHAAVSTDQGETFGAPYRLGFRVMSPRVSMAQAGGELFVAWRSMVGTGELDVFISRAVVWPAGAPDTPTPSPTPSPTETQAPESTSTSTATATPTPTEEAPEAGIPSPTDTADPSATSTAIPEATSTPTDPAEGTATPAGHEPETATPSHTPSATATNTPVPTASNTPQPTATNTPEATATNTPQPTATNTREPTAAATNTAVATGTPENAPNATATSTSTPSRTPGASPWRPGGAPGFEAPSTTVTVTAPTPGASPVSTVAGATAVRSSTPSRVAAPDAGSGPRDEGSGRAPGYLVGALGSLAFGLVALRYARRRSRG